MSSLADKSDGDARMTPSKMASKAALQRAQLQHEMQVLKEENARLVKNTHRLNKVIASFTAEFGVELLPASGDDDEGCTVVESTAGIESAAGVKAVAVGEGVEQIELLKTRVVTCKTCGNYEEFPNSTCLRNDAEEGGWTLCYSRPGCEWVCDRCITKKDYLYTVVDDDGEECHVYGEQCQVYEPYEMPLRVGDYWENDSKFKKGYYWAVKDGQMVIYSISNEDCHLFVKGESTPAVEQLLERNWPKYGGLRSLELRELDKDVLSRSLRANESSPDAELGQLGDEGKSSEWPSQTPMKKELEMLTALDCKHFKARGECFGDMLVVYSALAEIVPPNMGLHLPNLVSEPRQVFFIDFWCNIPLEEIRKCWFKKHKDGTDLTYLLRTLQPIAKFTGECEDKPPFYTEDDLKLANDDFDAPNIDDFDAPNIFPYKLCFLCKERKSCGAYTADKQWICDDHTCCTQCDRQVNCQREQIMLWDKDGVSEESLCEQCHEDMEEQLRKDGWTFDGDR